MRRLARLGPLLLALVLVAAGLFTYRWYFQSSLDLTSDPSGAEVTIDGRRVGVTPLAGEVLPPGMHLIELQHSFYLPYQRRMEFTRGASEMHVALQRGTGTLTLYSNPRGAWVEVDGERQSGVTPMRVELPSGEHEIAMGMDERRSATGTVTVAAGEDRKWQLELNIDPHGSLTVITEPGDARVALPGTEYEYQKGVRLPIGEYRIRVTRPGFTPDDQRKQIRFGDNVHRVTLKRAYAPLQASTDPPGARVQVSYRQIIDGPLVRRDHESGARLPLGVVEVRATAVGRRSAYRRIDLGPAGATLRLALQPMTVTPGSRMRDTLAAGGDGPELVVVPGGEFLMGSRDGPPSERPVRRVVLTQPFAVSVDEITVAEYARFAPPAQPPGPDDANLPVSRVDFEDAAGYAAWLTEQTGARYRLPSEAEWEYVARAGSASSYGFGDDAAALCAHGNVADRSLVRKFRSYLAEECDDGYAELAPVGSFPANAFGLHDVLGNVAEWVLDCGLGEYDQAPDDGTPVDAGTNCPTHGVRGGSWASAAAETRLSKRGIASSASGERGFRLVREL